MTGSSERDVVEVQIWNVEDKWQRTEKKIESHPRGEKMSGSERSPCG